MIERRWRNAAPADIQPHFNQTSAHFRVDQYWQNLAEAQIHSIAKQSKSAGGWDTHADNFTCLKKYLLPQFDQAFSALMEDLAQRGLLDDTLVLVTSEMGRKPKVGDVRSGGTGGAGRDHWTACMSVLMAGGGIRGGQEVGATDARAEYPKNRPIAPEDVVKTVYHAMGITNLEATDMLGRPYNLLEEGKPLMELFG